MTDDQRVADLQYMSKTRTLLTGAGSTFRNYFATFPFCCPSRATFLTGQYPHNHGVLGNAPPDGGYTKLDHNNTLPLWLQGAGYFTSHIGKYLNGYPPTTNRLEIPPGWHDWQGLFTGNQMYNYTINDNGVLVRKGDTAADYNTDVLANRAVSAIGQAARHQPFFLNIATNAPHWEPEPLPFPNPRPAPRHLNVFSREPLPRPPSFNEADVSDKPAFIRNARLFTATDVSFITARFRSRIESLLAVDDLVERVVNKLAATGVLNNTVIIFTSDNGYILGEHRIREGKIRVYQESSRVPLLIRGPGFPAGATVKQFVANIDLAPTIVDLANAAPGLVADGRSLLPFVQNSSVATPRDLLIETKGYEALRNQSFLYVEHHTGERELYDMRPGTANYDPYQLNSRHASSAYAQIRSQLATKLNALRTCSGASCGAQ
jgi:arylsulfatase A-like enzyme